MDSAETEIANYLTCGCVIIITCITLIALAVFGGVALRLFLAILGA